MLFTCMQPDGSGWVQVEWIFISNAHLLISLIDVVFASIHLSVYKSRHLDGTPKKAHNSDLQLYSPYPFYWSKFT